MLKLFQLQYKPSIATISADRQYILFGYNRRDVSD